MITSLREAQCRGQATKILKDFRVESPEEIDLPTICWTSNRRLAIEEGDLETADGRLIAGAEGGVIRVANSIKTMGRKRFIIAHEFAHFCLHKSATAIDTAKNLVDWNGTIETEANIMAAELLMPKELLVPRSTFGEPTLAKLDNLAEEFQTSSLATVTQFIEYTSECCALVFCENRKVKWFRRSENFKNFFIRSGVLHHYTGAAEIFDGKSGDTNGMVQTPAGAWLDRFEPNGKDQIKEDTRFWRSWNSTVTLLWVDDPIGEDF